MAPGLQIGAREANTGPDEKIKRETFQSLMRGKKIMPFVTASIRDKTYTVLPHRKDVQRQLTLTPQRSLFPTEQTKTLPQSTDREQERAKEFAQILFDVHDDQRKDYVGNVGHLPTPPHAQCKCKKCKHLPYF